MLYVQKAYCDPHVAQFAGQTWFDGKEHEFCAAAGDGAINQKNTIKAKHVNQRSRHVINTSGECVHSMAELPARPYKSENLGTMRSLHFSFGMVLVASISGVAQTPTFSCDTFVP